MRSAPKKQEKIDYWQDVSFEFKSDPLRAVAHVKDTNAQKMRALKQYVRNKIMSRNNSPLHNNVIIRSAEQNEIPPGSKKSEYFLIVCTSSLPKDEFEKAVDSLKENQQSCSKPGSKQNRNWFQQTFRTESVPANTTPNQTSEKVDGSLASASLALEEIEDFTHEIWAQSVESDNQNASEIVMSFANEVLTDAKPKEWEDLQNELLTDAKSIEWEDFQKQLLMDATLEGEAFQKVPLINTNPVLWEDQQQCAAFPEESEQATGDDSPIMKRHKIDCTTRTISTPIVSQNNASSVVDFVLPESIPILTLTPPKQGINSFIFCFKNNSMFTPAEKCCKPIPWENIKIEIKPPDLFIACISLDPPDASLLKRAQQAIVKTRNSKLKGKLKSQMLDGFFTIGLKKGVTMSAEEFERSIKSCKAFPREKFNDQKQLTKSNPHC